ncbi:unnamed protein product [Caenorhabditis nigoni]
MNPDSFCTEFKNQMQPNSGRRLSTSWDNEVKAAAQLAVPRVDQRRNSNTLAQLLECHRQLSLHDQSFEDEDDAATLRVPSRRASVGSRRPSVAEMLIDSGVANKTTDDCVMVQQTLGTSTTLFFQKNPLVDNLDLRPSPFERGLYNFDDSIKEMPPLKYVGTPRPSIQMNTSPRPSLLAKSSPSIDESDGERTPTMANQVLRPTIGERGLPAMKFTPVLANGQLQPRGRTLHKQPRADPRFDFELDKIIANRRRIVDEEETRRERENHIRPRSQTTSSIHHRPHNFDGRGPYQAKAGNVMEVTHHSVSNYFKYHIKLGTSHPIKMNFLKTNFRPELLDRPYVRASPSDQTLPDGKTPTKTVTIRVPPDQPNQSRGHFIHRSPTPSPNNVRLLTADEKKALRHNASKFEPKPPIDHPLDDAADNCRQS